MKYSSGKWLHTSSRGGFLLTPCRVCFSSITKAAALSGSWAAQQGGSVASAPQPPDDATYTECPTTTKTVLQASFCHMVSCWLQSCKTQILSTEGSLTEMQWWMPEDIFFWYKCYDVHRWTPGPKPSTSLVQVRPRSQPSWGRTKLTQGAAPMGRSKPNRNSAKPLWTGSLGQLKK